jgi:hypothetical protein
MFCLVYGQTHKSFTIPPTTLTLSKDNAINFFHIGGSKLNSPNLLSQIPNHTVCFTDLDHGSEILSRFSLPKSMKHSVDLGKLRFPVVYDLIHGSQSDMFRLSE